MLTGNLEQLEPVLADPVNEWDDLRQKSPENNVRPAITYEMLYHLDKAHTVRLNDEVYHLPSNVEAAFFVIKHRYGDRLRARTCLGQFRELVLRDVVRDIAMDAKG